MHNNTSNPIHTKGNATSLIHEKEKAELKKEQNQMVKTDRQLIDLGIRTPKVQTNFEHTFRKLPVEKKMLKRMRSEHNKQLRLNGFDPSKRMNCSGPQTIKSS